MTHTPPYWPALSSWGAGLLFAAMAAGAPAVGMVPLLMVALALFGWGGWCLRMGRVCAPRTAVVSALALLAAAAGILIVGLTTLVPFLGLAVLLAVLSISTGRRVRGFGAARRAGHPALALLGAAIIVASVTTPALASTEPGSFAVPHGEHQHG